MSSSSHLPVLSQIVELFKQADWQVVKSSNEMVDLSSLKRSLKRLNLWITEDEVKEVYLRLTSFPETTKLKQINELMFDTFKNGLKLKSGKVATLIDWSNPNKNVFSLVVDFIVMVDQTIKTYPLVGFINGLPLLIIQNNLASESYSELSGKLVLAAPQLIYYNPILIFVDERQTRIGSIYSEWANFGQWMRFNDFQDGAEWEVVIKQLVDKELLLAIIQSFLLSDIYGVMEKPKNYIDEVELKLQEYLHTEESKCYF